MMYFKNRKTEKNDREANGNRTVHTKSWKGLIALVVALAAVTVAVAGCGTATSTQTASAGKSSGTTVLSTPELSEANRKVAANVIHIVDEYVSGDLFPIQAVGKLNDAYESVQPAQDSRSKDITKELNDDIKKIKGELEKEEFLNYIINDTGGCDVSKVKQYRNDIAKIADINF